MKKLILFLFTLNAFYLSAQTNCGNALPFCAGGVAGVTFPASTGTTIGQTGPSYDCNGLVASPISYYVPSPSWYYIQVGASGSLDISIQGQLANGSPGGDVDYVCWGPFSSLAGICNSLTAGNTVDCSYSPSYTESLNIPNGIVGQYYMVVITNFYNQPQNIVLNQYGGTGSTNCNIVSNAAICAGGSKTITVSNSTSLTGVSYSLQPGGGTSTTGSFVVTPTVTTSYTTYISGTNSQNVVVTQTAVANVTVNPQPQTAVTATQTSCTSTVNGFNLGLSFNPSSASPTYTVSWSPTPNGITSASQTSLTGGINPNSYTATIVAQGGCSTTTVVTINPPVPLPNFTITNLTGSASLTCTYPTVDIIAANNYTLNPLNYYWSSASFTANTQSVTIVNPGTYSVIVTDPATNCQVTHSITITLNNTVPTSSVNPISQTIGCGPGVVATATGSAINPSVNVTHYWYAPGSPVPYVTGGPVSIFSPIVGTNTFVLVNDINGCSTTKTVEVLSNGGTYPTFNLQSVTQFTLGCGTQSLSNIMILNGQVPPNGGAVSYTVLPPAFTGTTYGFTTTTTYSLNSPGIYTVIVKSNNNACETRLPVSIIQNTFAPNVGFTASTQTLDCNTPSVTLMATSTDTAPVTYLWKSNGIPNTTVGYSLTVNTTTAGASVASGTVVDHYTLTVTDQNNTCTNTMVVTVYQNTRPPLAQIAGSSTLTCLYKSLNLSNNSSTGIIPGSFSIAQPIIGLLWEGPTPQLPKSNSSSYTALTPGIYTLTARDENNGCTSKTTTPVYDGIIYPVISASSPVYLDCGSLATLTANVVGLQSSAITSTWIPPASSPSVGGISTLTLTTAGTGDYKLVVTNKSNSCVSQTIITVVNGSLNAGFTADQQSGFAPLTVNFTNNSSSVNGTSSITTVWSFGNGTTKTTSLNSTPVSAIYNQAGTYTVTMFASKGACADSSSKVIVVDIPSKLEVPNVFTPNGDNSNDVFFLKTANLTNITALIYDRWGNKVYELSTDKGNIAWDGKNQSGKEVPDGTYFYVIKATGRDGQSYDSKGNVSLYR